MTPDLYDNVGQQEAPMWAGLKLLVINTALYWQIENWPWQYTYRYVYTIHPNQYSNSHIKSDRVKVYIITKGRLRDIVCMFTDPLLHTICFILEQN